MAERRVTVASKVGLHARPAMLFTQAVAASGTAVTIGRPGAPAFDASSILFVMGLGVRNGEDVVLAGDDEAVLDELAAMLARDLDAE
jgi:phosphocarrier protein